jgi:hypothetical protein
MFGSSVLWHDVFAKKNIVAYSDTLVADIDVRAGD